MPEDKVAATHHDRTLLDAEAKARREFLKTVAEGTAKGATIAPAVAMLLAALSKPGKALANNYGGCGGGSAGCGGGAMLMPMLVVSAGILRRRSRKHRR